MSFILFFCWIGNTVTVLPQQKRKIASDVVAHSMQLPVIKKQVSQSSGKNFKPARGSISSSKQRVQVGCLQISLNWNRKNFLWCKRDVNEKVGHYVGTGFQEMVFKNVSLTSHWLCYGYIEVLCTYVYVYTV